jgi:hypothetical protein
MDFTQRDSKTGSIVSLPTEIDQSVPQSHSNFHLVHNNTTRKKGRDAIAVISRACEKYLSNFMILKRKSEMNNFILTLDNMQKTAQYIQGKYMQRYGTTWQCTIAKSVMTDASIINTDNREFIAVIIKGEIVVKLKNTKDRSSSSYYAEEADNALDQALENDALCQNNENAMPSRGTAFIRDVEDLRNNDSSRNSIGNYNGRGRKTLVNLENLKKDIEEANKKGKRKFSK